MVYGWIYTIKCKLNNKIYIGQTITGFDKRYYGSGIKKTSNRHLKFAIQKYGEENFEVDKEYDVAYSKEELDELEKWYIYLYDATNPKYGYNFQSGGHNGRATLETRKRMSESLKALNKKLTKEQKLKISQRQQGKGNSFYGKTHSEVQCEKWSKERKGNRQTESWVEKKTQSLKQYYIYNQYTLEQKTRISEGVKKWYEHNESPRNKAVVCLTTGEIFKSSKQACEHYGLNRSCFSQKLKEGKPYGKLPDGTILQWTLLKENNNE